MKNTQVATLSPSPQLHFSEWKADNFRAVNKFYKRQKHKGSASGNERVFVVMANPLTDHTAPVIQITDRQKSNRPISDTQTTANQKTEPQIIAAVRLVPTDDYYWLRSLYVDESLRGQNIGSQLMGFVQQHISHPIHCFPYKHLEHFYQLAGYTIEPVDTIPQALQQLFERYSRKADNILIMSLPSKPD